MYRNFDPLSLLSMFYYLDKLQATMLYVRLYFQKTIPSLLRSVSKSIPYIPIYHRNYHHHKYKFTRNEENSKIQPVF